MKKTEKGDEGFECHQWLKNPGSAKKAFYWLFRAARK